METSEGTSDSSVYSEFREQLKETEHGYYETELLWKANAPELPENKQGSLIRLGKLVQRLERHPELFEKYDEIIRDHAEKGIVENVHHDPERKMLYMPTCSQISQS